jgi:IclR family transcriptional regulator, KDG regulon repressor
MQLVSGVQHAGQVLALFTPERPEWGAAETGRALTLSKAYAYRLLSTLTDVGLLERVEPSGRFRLSWNCMAYTSVLLATDELAKSGTAVIKKLNRECGIEPMLAVWRHGSMLSLQPSTKHFIASLELEDCVPVALVLMAGLPQDEREVIAAASRGLADFPREEKLDDCIRLVQSGRVLIRADSFGTDGQWIVAPVTDDIGAVIAALAVHLPGESRSITQVVTALLKKASTMISTAHSRGA